jgi:PleD family two-component response regulator
MQLGMGILNRNKVTEDLFLDRVNIELKRAERYRIFVSLLILDVGVVKQVFPKQDNSVMGDLAGFVQKRIRAIDNIALLGQHKLGFLFPETTRQGAEIASKRISELVKTRLSELIDERFDQVLPLEMASYPDAAGAKSISDFLKDYTKQDLN